MNPTTAAQCEGGWQPVSLPPEGATTESSLHIDLLRCSDCKEWMVIIEGRAYSRSPEATKLEALGKSLQEHLQPN